MHTNKPKNVNPVLTNIVLATPIVLKEYGKTNVPMAAPIRLMAVVNPTAVARISVGKSSFG